MAVTSQQLSSSLATLIETLRERLGAAQVLTGDDVASRQVDWLSGAPCRAAAIVRPGTPSR